ncbi:hypothetical protein OS31_40510 [Dickeya oryzae]
MRIAVPEFSNSLPFRECDRLQAVNVENVNVRGISVPLATILSHQPAVSLQLADRRPDSALTSA